MTEEALAPPQGRLEDGTYIAQCRRCGRWRPVTPQKSSGLEFFAILEAEFTCCGVSQRVQFMVEKDYLDFH